MISFENDAAQSQLALYESLADLRKAEGQFRLFTFSEEKPQ